MMQKKKEKKNSKSLPPLSTIATVSIVHYRLLSRSASLFHLLFLSPPIAIINIMTIPIIMIIIINTTFAKRIIIYKLSLLFPFSPSRHA